MAASDKRAVVLVSGGLDSATVLAIARSQGYELFALSFRYGQRHSYELEAATNICSQFEVVRHETLDLDLRAFGGSALTAEIDVPKDRSEDEMSGGIPITYVPARNTIFLSIALGWAEVLKANDIFIGVNAVDYSGYPDCRPEFIKSFQQTANLATKTGVEGTDPFQIHTPLIDLTKAEIIHTGTKLGVDYSQTLSCYDPAPGGLACGHCDSCQLRRKGFADAGLPDPTKYVTA
ncbi:7-cyano-7-deazaguanine synthase QueC [Polystyrenella longa]|nr:7-cyano-7-deazaguanine synthase QueC [Polystyrenella longa]